MTPTYVQRARTSFSQRFPVAGQGDVFVTKTGSVYHSGRCQALERVWDMAVSPVGLAPEHDALAAGRRLCRSCKADELLYAN